MICNDFVIGTVVEKTGYGVEGGPFTDVMRHSSINYHHEHNLTYGHKKVAGTNCGEMYSGYV